MTIIQFDSNACELQNVPDMTAKLLTICTSEIDSVKCMYVVQDMLYAAICITQTL